MKQASIVLFDEVEERSMSMKLVPNPGSKEVIHYIPTLQAISMNCNHDASQLGLICNSTVQLIFFKGRHLDQLADLISARRIKSIEVFDPKKHINPADSDPVVTEFQVELRGPA